MEKYQQVGNTILYFLREEGERRKERRRRRREDFGRFHNQIKI
jgi:hypothetical protein